MADQLIRAGIVLTGDAAGAVAAFAATRREADTLKLKFAEAQAEVNRLARELSAFRSVGVQPLGVTASFEQAKETARALASQLEAAQIRLEGARRSLGQFGVNTTTLNADLARLKAGLAESGKQAERAGAQFDSLGRSLLGVARQLAGLAGVGIGVGTVRAAIQTADAYQLVEQRLKLVTRSAAELAAVERELFDSAQRTRSNFIDLAEVYARTARGAKDAGIEQARLLKINEAINQSIIISGVSAQSAQGALIQFGQALASDRLSGDELRSVLEQAPRLAQAIADGIGVSLGELRKLGEEGQLTAEKVLGAIEKQIPRLKAEFETLQPTASQAFTNLTNAAGLFVDKLNESDGLTRKLAQTFQFLAGAVEDFARRQDKANKTETRLDLETQAGAARKLASLFSAIGADGVAEKFLRERGEILARLAPLTEDVAQTQRELNRAYDQSEPPAKATQAFLEVQAKLSGINQGFTKDLNTLFQAYSKGVIPVEKYRDLVAKLIETETEAGKSAKQAAEARAKAQRDLVEGSVKDQQRLIDAVRKSFEDELAAAKKFAEEAAKLREQAADVRSGASARASDRRNAGLDPAEADGRNAVRASILIDQSSAAARQSGTALAKGDAEAALKLAERAKKLGEEAAQFADKVTDNDRAANLIELAGNAAAKGIEAAAKVAESQAANAKAVAEAQAQTLSQLEERAKALQAALAALPVKLQTDEAVAQFEALKALFGQGFTVPLRTAANDAAPPALAAGGLLRGPGTGTSDSLLARVSNGEFVQRAAAVDYYGVAFMERLNRLQLPRFAAGGIVDRVRVHEPANSGGGSATTINLNLGAIGSFAVQAESAVADELARAVRRETLKRGRR